VIALYRNLFPAMWLAWALYWWISSRDVKAEVRREPAASRAAHVIPLAIAALLLWWPRMDAPVLDLRYVPPGPGPFWIGAAVTAAGLLFCVWARLHIGRNWSGIVTLKEDHELVTSGPYALVRHPIYTGLLAALAGSAFARGDVRGVLAFVIAFVALWRKMGVEERFMEERFGDAYRAYRARVKRLVPFVW